VLRKTSNHLVLKLIASKILAPEKAIKSDKPAVMLKWGRREKKDQEGEIMLVSACKDDDLWKHVPESS
jgi:acyl-CoA synthetase (NDP forming)